MFALSSRMTNGAVCELQHGGADWKPSAAIYKRGKSRFIAARAVKVEGTYGTVPTRTHNITRFTV